MDEIVLEKAVTPVTTKKPRRVSKKEEVIALPQHLDHLVHYFSVIDATACFLNRKHLPCTISRVKSMVMSSPKPVETLPSFSEHIFKQVLHIGSAILRVRRIPNKVDWQQVLSPTGSPHDSPPAFEAVSFPLKPTTKGTGATVNTALPELPDIALEDDSHIHSDASDAGVYRQPANSVQTGPVLAPVIAVTVPAITAKSDGLGTSDDNPSLTTHDTAQEDENWLEITLEPAGGGAAKVTQRKKLFRDALNAYVKRHLLALFGVKDGDSFDMELLEAIPEVPIMNSYINTVPMTSAAEGPTRQELQQPQRDGACTPPQQVSKPSNFDVLFRFTTDCADTKAAVEAVKAKQKLLTASPGGIASTVAALTNRTRRVTEVGIPLYERESRNKKGGEPDETGEQSTVQPIVSCTYDNAEAYLSSQSWYVDQIISCQERDGKPATFGSVTPPLPEAVAVALREKGITQLFTHQAIAINAASKGKHVAIATATSSGKSLTYNVPVFKELTSRPASVAIYMFPTKALAQDQLRSLDEFVASSHSLRTSIVPACLDGDVGFAERGDVLRRANIILTNPDTLHATVLPQHNHWRRVLENLKFVVLDEAHVYRGVFGAHVALVMRRLLRLCEHYGSSPQFFSCSATIANPLQHLCNLVPVVNTENVQLITNDDEGCAVGSRKLIVWTPPLVTDTTHGNRAKITATGESSATDSDKEKDSPTPVKKPARRRKTAKRKAIEVADQVESLTDLLYAPGENPPEHRGKRGRAENGLFPLEDDELEAENPTPDAVFNESRLEDEATTTLSSAAATIENSKTEKHDDVGSLLLRPNDYGQYAVFNTHLDEDYAARARHARFGGSATRKPTNYRVSSTAAPSRLGVEKAAFVPRWVERYCRQQDDPATHRRSTLSEASFLFASLVGGGLRTIVFCRVRKVAELVLQYTHERLAATDAGLELIPAVKSYRAGYLKQHRRLIESELFGGRLKGVIATNALELGIDIGSLDAVLILGYPGSVASFWQQAGRAGRGGRNAVIIFLANENPVDQHFATHPAQLIAKPPEAVCLDATNPRVLRPHILCAGAELPLEPKDLTLFGNALGDVMIQLREQGSLLELEKFIGRVAFKTAAWIERPASRVNLRSIDDVVYKVLDDSNGGILVDEVEESRAYWEIHEGAMYMNQGVTYKIYKMDIAKKEVRCRVSTEQYYTNVRDHTDVNALSRDATLLHGRTHVGRAQVISHAWGYRKMWKRTGQMFEMCELHLPPIEFVTHALWTDLSIDCKRALDARGLDFLGGCHGAAHAVIAAFPLFVMCDRVDLGTECPSPLQVRARPFRFIVFDNHPGGMGIVTAASAVVERVYAHALAMVEGCDCLHGCPRCIHDMHCKEFNYVLDKQAAIYILREALHLNASATAAEGGKEAKV